MVRSVLRTLKFPIVVLVALAVGFGAGYFVAPDGNVPEAAGAEVVEASWCDQVSDAFESASNETVAALRAGVNDRERFLATTNFATDGTGDAQGAAELDLAVMSEELRHAQVLAALDALDALAGDPPTSMGNEIAAVIGAARLYNEQAEQLRYQQNLADLAGMPMPEASGEIPNGEFAGRMVAIIEVECGFAPDLPVPAGLVEAARSDLGGDAD